MKLSLLLFSLIVISSAFAQTDTVNAAVYNWTPTGKKIPEVEWTQLIVGATKHLEELKVEAISIPTSRGFNGLPASPLKERMIIVLGGSMDIELNGSPKTLSSGSVVLIMPPDQFKVLNRQEATLHVYFITYRSRRKSLNDTVKSRIIDWNDRVFKPGEKGGRRDYLNQETWFLSRLETHVTTLNAGLQNHNPHTHVPEEIVILLKGQIEIQIGTDKFLAERGDFIFLTSEKLHGAKNIGKGEAIYFAIQLQ